MKKPPLPTDPTPVQAPDDALRHLGRVLLTSIILVPIIGLSVYHFCQPTDPIPDVVVKAKKVGIPFGVSKNRALTYKKLPDVIVGYVWVGYENTSTPHERVESEWQHFGQIISTEDVGSLLGKGGTLVKVTVQKDPCWNAWEPDSTD
jgi:hypothetical protein